MITVKDFKDILIYSRKLFKRVAVELNFPRENYTKYEGFPILDSSTNYFETRMSFFTLDKDYEPAYERCIFSFVFSGTRYLTRKQAEECDGNIAEMASVYTSNSDSCEARHDGFIVSTQKKEHLLGYIKLMSEIHNDKS